ncbi:hypothetical protein MuYL_3540 [Mucilaginibacter xinganensis]|uniref:Uncharacterized protein n=1 Tax=Mucilaginibacter xinganensis TaxID=1234841 RepID=A0A223NZZ3_9SPHI|nr:hypothetical protein MuYL_3540 [Mucilaginibacter xinganensis]
MSFFKELLIGEFFSLFILFFYYSDNWHVNSYVFINKYLCPLYQQPQK